jgi:DNA-binding GntR family transcriptional regulator
MDNTGAAVTKLSQISNAIVADIEAGVLREGDQLPSEERLAAAHRVSVGTVQKALARLAHSGLISREHGRGTFVSGTSVAPAEVRYLRFRDDDGNELPSFVHVRSVRRTARKGPWSDFLGGEAFVRIERSINVGGRLDLYSEFWLKEEDFARLGGVSRRALEKNLRALLGKQLALPTLRADQWIHFAPLPASAARALDLEPGEPGFIMELRGYTLRDQHLYYQTLYSGQFSERLVIVR